MTADEMPIMKQYKALKREAPAVSKPTDEIDEPYIGEMFHAALVKQGVAASCEAWPVLVVDRRGRVVGEIPHESK